MTDDRKDDAGLDEDLEMTADESSDVSENVFGGKKPPKKRPSSHLSHNNSGSGS